MSRRYLGTAYISVLTGSDILDSYKRYRRRRSQMSKYRKVFCGADIVKCGGADPCGGLAEPYVNIILVDGGGVSYRVGRTETLAATSNPVWKYQTVTVIDTETDPLLCVVDANAKRPHLKFQLMDDDGGGDAYYYSDDLIGEATLFLDTVCDDAANQSSSGHYTLDLIHPKSSDNLQSGKVEVRSKLTVFIHYEDMLSNTSKSLATVPGTYYKRSRGNKVRLYHDAHCEPGDFEDVVMTGGPLDGFVYKAQNCWRDMYFDILGAKHLILICGWSVNTDIKLVRSGDGFEDGSCPKLGDMLLQKAEEGCTVCVMVWDDVTSLQTIGLAKDGLMGTYDEYTRQFFQNTKVHCIIAKRVAGDDQSFMLGPMYAPLKASSFTHHQKIVLCDTQQEFGAPGDRRSLTAYVGGLDLTSGRYDTGRHNLHATLNKDHKEDFYQMCDFTVNPAEGPREPWHDIHSRVEGPAAWDLYDNYTERCARESQEIWHKITSAVKVCLDKQLILNRSGIACERNPPTDYKLNSPKIRAAVSWSCQVFRSIDTENAVFFNKTFQKMFNRSDYLMTDKSVQAAYLYAIDRSKRFIYIENQYFLGSSQYWLIDNDTPCPHLVPYALAKRIVRAIRDNEEFVCYVMNPLYPEGVPSSASVMEILHWQHCTLSFMYHAIGQAIRKFNRDTHPQDYLQFWFPAAREQCVVDRETRVSDSPSTSASGPESAGQMTGEAILTNQYSKFQIYVHSKMILIDDEWICIGSCNINERSMAGGRDSEIAVGLSQDQYMSNHTLGLVDEPIVLPKGDIYAFRIQLWQEHFHCINSLFDDPGSFRCSRMLLEWLTENLDALHAKHAIECTPGTLKLPLPHGHACLRPMECTHLGLVVQHSRWPHVLHTTVPVVGAKSMMLPGPLTT